MAEGTDNVEDRLSCDDSSYDERNLEVSDSGNGVHSGSEDEEDGGDGSGALGMEPYQFEPIGPVHDSASGSSSDDDVEEEEWRLTNTNWCANTLRVSSTSFAQRKSCRSSVFAIFRTAIIISASVASAR